jgi:hypothetical protein
MAKAETTPSTSEQAAEPAREEVIPFLVLETFGFNEQGLFVKKTEYIDQRAALSGQATPLKRRKRWRAEAVEPVAKELWPPDGKPAETISTPDALQRLGDELQRRKIPASPTTQRRVIGRRPR